MQVQKILVPVDFSEGSRAAIDLAEELARRLHARLVLFHAYVVPMSPLPDGAAMISAQQMVDTQAAIRGLIDRSSERIVTSGVEVDAKIVPGNAWSEICREAKEGAYDLIVLGTHGRTGLKHVLLGSVAERVVRHAPCPVLTVKRKA